MAIAGRPHAAENAVEFTLPGAEYGARWAVPVNTAAEPAATPIPAGSEFTVGEHSLVLLIATAT